MGRYDDNLKGNITARLMQKGIKPNPDGKVRLNLTVHEDSPWITGKYDPERHCEKWLHRYFAYFSLVPWQCTGCWKIYHNPKTLKDLFEIREFQRDDEKNFRLPRKCGYERRGFTGNKGGYTAFWYNPLFCGLDVARHNVKRLREALGRENIYLKRGCTEMEVFTVQQLKIDSSGWSQLVSENSLDLQRRLDEMFITYGTVPNISAEMEAIIENRWIENAVEVSKITGDMTYLEYYDEDPLVRVMNYAGSIHRANDYVGGKDGEHYLINLVGRRKAEKYFGKDFSRGGDLVVPELEAFE